MDSTSLDAAPADGASLAVVAHEIPQEAGDFGILLHSGYSRTRAALYNSLSACTTPLGAAAVY